MEDEKKSNHITSTQNTTPTSMISMTINHPKFGKKVGRPLKENLMDKNSDSISDQINNSILQNISLQELNPSHKNKKQQEPKVSSDSFDITDDSLHALFENKNEVNNKCKNTFN